MGLSAQGFYIYHRMADYFANYAFGFLIFGTVSLLLDNFRKRFLKIFKLIFLSIIILMIAVFPAVVYFNSDCKIAVKDINVLVGSKIKEVYLKTFNKNLLG